MAVAGYNNELNKPVRDDVGKWFENGVKTDDLKYKQGICSKKTTLYVILFTVGFIVLAVIIMVPVIVGNATKTQGG